MKPIIVFLTLVLMTFPAQAGGKQTMTYDVYAGGIHALSATLTLEDESSRYSVVLRAATIGFLKTLAPWSGTFSTLGWTGKSRQPERHLSLSTWKGETEKKEFTFRRNGEFVAYKLSTDGREKPLPKPDVKLVPQGITDLLSATLGVMDKLEARPLCRGESLIFDGDRNFNLRFKNGRTVVLDKGDYNIYGGSAIACEVEVEPKAGKWRKKPRGWLSIQEQGRKQGALPTVWFGRPGGKGAAYVPVKIMVKTDYGTLFMHLTSYHRGAPEKISASVRKTE